MTHARAMPVTDLVVIPNADRPSSGPHAVVTHQREASYPSRRAAERAIQRGWIPEQLPTDAHAITVRYDLRTTERVVMWTGRPLRSVHRLMSADDDRALGRAPVELEGMVTRTLDGYVATVYDSWTYWVPAPK